MCSLHMEVSYGVIHTCSFHMEVCVNVSPYKCQLTHYASVLSERSHFLACQEIG